MRANKYRNVITEIDGEKYDSKREAERHQELLMLERAGEITHLERQPRFKIFQAVRYRGEKMRDRYYVADFGYQEVATGEDVVEDVKSRITQRNQVYRLKRQMFLGIYGYKYKFVETL